jgi:hypothetical protein
VIRVCGGILQVSKGSLQCFFSPVAPFVKLACCRQIKRGVAVGDDRGEKAEPFFGKLGNTF